MRKKSKTWGRATQGIRSAQARTGYREHSPPIFATSSFVYDSADQAAAVFADAEPGYIYSRFTNPTVEAFEQRLALMEGAPSCVATSSGMAAELTLLMALLRSGDHVLASRTLFGSTLSLFNNFFVKFGVEFTYVDPVDLDAWRAGVRRNTKLLFAETPTNPLGEIVDIAALSGIARKAGALLCIDNCFLTPALQQPMAFGADLVIHSATKYLDGQGRCVGGALLGDAQRVGKEAFSFMRTAGPCLSPFNAWIFLKGLETLSLRMQAHSDAALELARWLERQPKVSRVYFPGLKSHPQHALAKRQQQGWGGVVAFEVAGGRRGAFRLINSTRMLSITANLGDTRTTITHPASTTHHRIGPEARKRAGIGEGLVRIAVGLEDVADIIEDLRNGLK